MKIRNLFRSKNLKVFLPETKAKLIKSFSHGGHDYYQFENGFDMSAGRGLMAMTFYQEFQMRCDYDYLRLHVKAISHLLKQKTVSIIDLAEIHNNLRDRLELAPFPGHIYKLASVLFFDESESPFSYDPLYNEKKIAAWRADPEFLPFLVKAPLKTLMPFSQLPNEDLEMYFKVTEAMNKMQHGKMSEALSKLQ